jgi:hypothetical protein
MILGIIESWQRGVYNIRCACCGLGKPQNAFCFKRQMFPIKVCLECQAKDPEWFEHYVKKKDVIEEIFFSYITYDFGGTLKSSILGK